jgi:hypothetical protein
MAVPEIVNPNIGDFIYSLRSVGYSFEIAAADLIDNSITAGASKVKINFAPKPTLVFSLLDNGGGMTEEELIEAMRLGSKATAARSKDDLGRFGLGLKIASFSQCKKLTVVTKKDSVITARQWDLEFISAKNEWLLVTPFNIDKLPLADELENQKTGTLVCWECIDRVMEESLPVIINRLSIHLALVFHRYLEGMGKRKLKINVNGQFLAPFDPFNAAHPATQQFSQEKILFRNQQILVQPYVLPHHSKLSREEYERYATEEGYLRSQGFYLYRLNRILTYGTWWGLHRAADAHKLVRIKVDIPASMDLEWELDVKKSAARPPEGVRFELKRIAAAVGETGSRPYTGRGRKIEDKSINKFWQLVPNNEEISFAVNKQHPLYKDLISKLDSGAVEKLNFYLKGLQAYLPLDAIQFHLQQHPHAVKQQEALTEDDIYNAADKLKSAGLPDEFIKDLLNTEIFGNKPDLLKNGNQ